MHCLLNYSRQPGLTRWISVWIMPQVQCRSAHLLPTVPLMATPPPFPMVMQNELQTNYTMHNNLWINFKKNCFLWILFVIVSVVCCGFGVMSFTLQIPGRSSRLALIQAGQSFIIPIWIQLQFLTLVHGLQGHLYGSIPVVLVALESHSKLYDKRRNSSASG